MVLMTLALAGASVAEFSLHLGIRPVLSGSMRPTYGPGWAILTRSIPVTQVRPGDIVVFTPPGSAVQYAHRVVSVTASTGGPVITTKGDANPAPDPWHARLDRSRTIPEVVAEVPALGWVMVDIRQEWTHLLLVIITGLGFCYAGTRAILQGGRGAATGSGPRFLPPQNPHTP